MPSIFARSKEEGLEAYRRWKAFHGDPPLDELRLVVDELPVHCHNPPPVCTKAPNRKLSDETTRARESRYRDKGYPQLERNHTEKSWTFRGQFKMTSNRDWQTVQPNSLAEAIVRPDFSCFRDTATNCYSFRPYEHREPKPPPIEFGHAMPIPFYHPPHRPIGRYNHVTVNQEDHPDITLLRLSRLALRYCDSRNLDFLSEKKILIGRRDFTTVKFNNSYVKDCQVALRAICTEKSYLVKTKQKNSRQQNVAKMDDASHMCLTIYCGGTISALTTLAHFYLFTTSGLHQGLLHQVRVHQILCVKPLKLTHSCRGNLRSQKS
ncbi:hypothetical protein RRG08_050234 [Elysia crispata]|uniref:Uncharacterized protein n=1 Tax=Elysia crispata TaxID=231223 RepID=A0AAE1E9W3_9GAST|nr:hypothetical protein RRG08_050234 [Elysia crispata]